MAIVTAEAQGLIGAQLRAIDLPASTHLAQILRGIEPAASE